MMRALLPIAATLLVLAPAASAHTTASSEDGQVRVVIGLLAEPVVTYQKTGLDVCFTRNTTAREPVTVNPGALTATLRSPGGEQLQLPLATQFGRAGCYQFDQPFILTEAGQYVVDLSGTAADSTVDLRDVKAGGAVRAQGDVTFPEDAQDLLQLQSQVAALQARVQALEAQKADHRDAPASGLVVLAGLAAVALLVRRRSA